MTRFRSQGQVEEGFEPLAAALDAALRSDPEVGASLAVYHRGRRVVDLWGGTADPSAALPWEADTLAIAFSCGKGLMAICAYMLVEAGLLDLDAPVASYWPQLSSAGKIEVTVRHVLSHRAGLPMLPARLELADLTQWSRVVAAYRDEEPLWQPGTTHGYHTLSVGYLFGEVVRRLTDATPGEYLAQRIARPLGVDAWIGLPPELAGRVAPPRPQLAETAVAQPPVSDGLTWDQLTLGRAFPEGLVQDMSEPANRAVVLGAEIPAANLVTNARSLARIYAATLAPVDGIRLLSSPSVDDGRRLMSTGESWKSVTMPEYRWGTGFMLHSPPVRPMLSGASFGHDGAGGSLGFADVDSEVGFGFVSNRVSEASYRRADPLVDSLRSCLGALR